MYEEIFLVVEGRGTTEVWLEGETKKHVFEWQKGSMFSIPMNAMHRLVNATSGGALLLAGTTAPNVLNQLNNVEAVFNNPFHFRDRFSGADDFFLMELERWLSLVAVAPRPQSQRRIVARGQE